MTRARSRLHRGLHRGVQRGAALVGAIAVALYLASGLYSVDNDESAVAFLLGRVVERDVEPGVHYVWPWPFGRTLIAKTRTSVSMPIGEADGALSMTAGGSLVHASLEVQYAIASLTDYTLSHTEPRIVVEALAERVLNAFLVSVDVDDVLTVRRQLLRQSVQRDLQQAVDEAELGITVQTVNIARLAPPAEGGVERAFQEVQNASADRDRALQSAQASAAQLLSRARTEARQIETDARALANSRVEIAKGETDRFLSLAAEYHRAPTITRTRLYLDGMRSIIGKTTTFVLPADQRTGSRGLTVED